MNSFYRVTSAHIVKMNVWFGAGSIQYCHLGLSVCPINTYQIRYVLWWYHLHQLTIRIRDDDFAVNARHPLSNSTSYIVNELEHFLGLGWEVVLPVQWGPSWTSLNMSRGILSYTEGSGARYCTEGGVVQRPLHSQKRQTNTTEDITFLVSEWPTVKAWDFPWYKVQRAAYLEGFP